VKVGAFLDHFLTNPSATVADVNLLKQLIDPKASSAAAATLINPNLAASTVANMPVNAAEHRSSRYGMHMEDMNPVLQV
jgi:hypothetical protein